MFGDIFAGIRTVGSVKSDGEVLPEHASKKGDGPLWGIETDYINCSVFGDSETHKSGSEESTLLVVFFESNRLPCYMKNYLYHFPLIFTERALWSGFFYNLSLKKSIKVRGVLAPIKIFKIKYLIHACELELGVRFRFRLSKECFFEGHLCRISLVIISFLLGINNSFLQTLLLGNEESSQ